MKSVNDSRDHGTRLNLYEGDKQVGTVVYDWVSSLFDIYLCDHKGMKTTGEVLYVSDIVVEPGDPKRMLRLNALLPKARWICGLRDKTKLAVPRGLPKGFWR